MPSSQGNGNHQRRVFRGRAGPTDGNLPPKKNTRPKVKYQPAEDNQAGGGHNGRRRSVDDDENFAESNQENVHAPENSSLDPNILQPSLDDDAEEVVPPKILEIRHLEKRIQNVQLSLQTSQGLTNPKIWRTNCLFPVRKAVKEWRSILMYHFAVDTNLDTNKGKEEEEGDEINNHDHQSDLHSTSQQVFGLIQMAMQSGPLVGSNAGYFKRCGGEVASIAFEFLGEIVELAEVEEKICADCAVGEDGFNGSDQDDGACEADLEVATLENQEEGFKRESDVNPYNSDDSSESEDDARSESGSSSSSLHDENMENLADAPIGAAVPKANSRDASSSNVKKVQRINNLQRTLLFTEKQSQRFCQWYRNAEKAMTINKPPSASATKLQNQKSKKQKQKEQRWRGR